MTQRKRNQRKQTIQGAKEKLKQNHKHLQRKKVLYPLKNKTRKLQKKINWQSRENS